MMNDVNELEVGAIVVQEGGPHLRHLVVGYLRAYARFEHALAKATPVEHAVEFRQRSWEALFEALNWADAIDQFMARGDPGRGADPAWLANSDAQTQGVLRGLQHARNVVHHQWWVALALRMGLTSEQQLNTWIWGTLPPNNRSKDGARAYAQYLHNRPAVEALRTLRDALWAIRAWGISAEDLAQDGYPLPPGISL